MLWTIFPSINDTRLTHLLRLLLLFSELNIYLKCAMLLTWPHELHWNFEISNVGHTVVAYACIELELYFLDSILGCYSVNQDILENHSLRSAYIYGYIMWLYKKLCLLVYILKFWINIHHKAMKEAFCVSTMRLLSRNGFFFLQLHVFTFY